MSLPYLNILCSENGELKIKELGGSEQNNMIPYIQTDGKNKINCNSDLIILDESEPILISLCDINIKNKKI